MIFKVNTVYSLETFLVLLKLYYTRFCSIYIHYYVVINVLLFAIINIIFITIVFSYEIVDDICSEEIEWHKPVIIYSVYYQNGDIYQLSPPTNSEQIIPTGEDYMPSFSELQTIENLTTNSDDSERFKEQKQDSYIETSITPDIIIDSQEVMVVIPDIIVLGEPLHPNYCNNILSEFNNKISISVTLGDLVKTSINAVEYMEIPNILNNGLNSTNYRYLIDTYLQEFDTKLSIPPRNLHLFKIALYIKYEMVLNNLSLDYHYDDIYNSYYTLYATENYKQS